MEQSWVLVVRISILRIDIEKQVRYSLYPNQIHLPNIFIDKSESPLDQNDQAWQYDSTT